MPKISVIVTHASEVPKVEIVGRRWCGALCALIITMAAAAHGALSSGALFGHRERRAPDLATMVAVDVEDEDQTPL